MPSTLPNTLAALLLAASTASAAITMPTVSVGDAGNPTDPATGNEYGAVAYDYEIGTHEVTNSQYTEFLNAVAVNGDPNNLHNKNMSILFGEGTYVTSAPNEPVAYTSFWNAARFANWLTNGQPTGSQGTGTTEDGAYTLTSSEITNNTVTRGSWYDEAAGNTSSETVFAVASEDEWYKAAYYDGDGGYYLYPTESNAAPTDVAPGNATGSNNANYNNVVGSATEVGAYPNSGSYYGTFDQGGNVQEWNDGIQGIGSGSFSSIYRGVRGGAFDDSSPLDLQSSDRPANGPAGTLNNLGFRVTSLAPIPEPSSYGAIFGIVGLATAVFFRRRRRRE